MTLLFGYAIITKLEIRKWCGGNSGKQRTAIPNDSSIYIFTRRAIGKFIGDYLSGQKSADEVLADATEEYIKVAKKTVYCKLNFLSRGVF